MFSVFLRTNSGRYRELLPVGASEEIKYLANRFEVNVFKKFNGYLNSAVTVVLSALFSLLNILKLIPNQLGRMREEI
jgi:hypothetical protein